MNRIHRVALIACLGLVSLVRGNGTPEKPTSATIERLIEQLGHEDYRQRDAASKAIGEVGPAALPALRKVKDHEDAEVRRRVGDLILTLERAKLLAPKLITLRLKDRPLRQAVTEMAKQTGYQIEMWPDAASNGDREKQPFSFELEKVPFWEALERRLHRGWGGLAGGLRR